MFSYQVRVEVERRILGGHLLRTRLMLQLVMCFQRAATSAEAIHRHIALEIACLYIAHVCHMCPVAWSAETCNLSLTRRV